MKYTSGQIVPQSGIYGVYTSSGVKTNEATCVKGEPFPPTPAPNMYYKSGILHRQFLGAKEKLREIWDSGILHRQFLG